MLPILLAILCCIIVGYFVHSLLQKRQNLPPGPIPLPFFGNLYQIDSRQPQKTLTKWSKKYGPIYTVWVGPVPTIVLSDYQLMKEYFLKEGDTFTGRSGNFVSDYISGSRGIIYTDGYFWKEQRGFFLQVLRNFGSGKNAIEEKVLVEVDRLVQEIEHVLERENGKMSFKRPLELCVGNIINTILFGYDLKLEDTTQFQDLKEHLEDFLKVMGRPEVALLSSYPWLKRLPLFEHFGFNVIKKFREGMEEILEQQVEEHNNNFEENTPNMDFASAFRKEMIHKQKTASGDHVTSFTEDQLKAVVGDVWLGMEVTVVTLKWAILYMIHFPVVQENCAREIRNLVKSRQSKVVKMSDKNILPYTVATLNEVQRRANVVPQNVRHTVTEDVVIQGHKIKTGSIIVPEISAVLDDPAVFPNPEKFDPERFLDKGKHLKEVEEFLPFSIGKRRCLGENLTKTILFLVFSNLIQCFSFGKDPDHPFPHLTPQAAFTTIQAPEEFKVFVEER